MRIAQIILQDLELLGVKPDKHTYTSDSFPVMVGGWVDG